MIIMTIVIIKDGINFSITPQKVLKSISFYVKKLRYISKPSNVVHPYCWKGNLNRREQRINAMN